MVCTEKKKRLKIKIKERPKHTFREDLGVSFAPSSVTSSHNSASNTFPKCCIGMPYLSATARIETCSYNLQRQLYSISAERIKKSIKSNTES